MSQARFGGSCQLKRMMFVIVPASKVDRIACASAFIHPHHIHKEVSGLFQLRSQQFNMTKMSDIEDGFRVCHFLFLSKVSRRPCRSYEICPASNFSRRADSFANRSSDAASTSAMRSRFTHTAPSTSMTTISPFEIGVPPTVTIVFNSPIFVFVAPR